MTEQQFIAKKAERQNKNPESYYTLAELAEVTKPLVAPGFDHAANYVEWSDPESSDVDSDEEE